MLSVLGFDGGGHAIHRVTGEAAKSDCFLAATTHITSSSTSSQADTFHR